MLLFSFSSFPNTYQNIYCSSTLLFFSVLYLQTNGPAYSNFSIDGRKYERVTFPYMVKIARGFDETVVKAQCDGYRPLQLIIDKKFNAVSVLNLGDVLGWGIDAATGAIMKPEFKYYELEFEKIADEVSEQ